MASVGKGKERKNETSSSSNIRIDKERLTGFIKSFKLLLQSCEDIIEGLYEYDIVPPGPDKSLTQTQAANKNVIKTLRERTTLYKRFFAETRTDEMDIHYEIFQMIYKAKKSGILRMVDTLCNDNEMVDTKWLTTDGKGVTAVAYSGNNRCISLHLTLIFKLGMQLRKVVDIEIDEKYDDVDDMTKEEAEEKRENEKSDRKELWYVDKFLLSLISVFHSLVYKREETMKLKVAISYLYEFLPEESNDSGGIMGNFGSLINTIVKNLPQGMGDGQINGDQVGKTLTETLKNVLGGDNSPLKKVIDDISNSKNISDMTRSISDAINNPDIAKVVNRRTDDYDEISKMKPPPKSIDDIDASSNEGVNEGNNKSVKGKNNKSVKVKNNKSVKDGSKEASKKETIMKNEEGSNVNVVEETADVCIDEK